MDAAKSVSEPLHGFMIDSVRLVRRCNKPNRKGMFFSFSISTTCSLLSHPSLFIYFSNFRCQTFLLMLPSYRVYEDLNSYSCRLCRHGIHRFLRSSHSHSCQYHFAWYVILPISLSLLRQIPKTNHFAIVHVIVSQANL